MWLTSIVSRFIVFLDCSVILYTANIVNLHEVLTSSKNLYMVMDLVTGGELFDAVAESGRLSEARTRLYFQQLVDGVHYCHTRRVYHRDLKPENLLLSGDKQALKITDFGLSSIKAQNASSELLHTIMGSPHYIAPEIITSASEGYEGSKVDVWAAGVILFGMLAGFLPFDESNTKGLYKAIVQNPVQFPPHFSYDVIKLLRAMLQKDPNRRPSMEQVKSFTWFKVDYEPAIIPELTHAASTEITAKKSRSKSRKHTERSTKTKRKEHSAEKESRKSMDRAASRRSVEKSRSGKQMDNSVRSGRQDSKPISGLLRDTSRDNSVFSEQFSEKGSVAASDDTSCKQENGDPHQTEHEEQLREPLETQTVQEKSSSAPVNDTRLKSASKSSLSIGDHVDGAGSLSEQERASQNDERDGGTLFALQSTTSVPYSAPTSSSSVIANICPREAELCSQEKEKRNQEEIDDDASAPGEGDATSKDRRGLNVHDDGNREEFANDELCSPLSPGASRFSPMNPASPSSFSREGRREALRFGSNALGAKPIELGDFISPISLQSLSSFTSPRPERASTSIISPEYRSLFPRFSQSSSFHKGADSRKEERKEERMIPIEPDAQQEPNNVASPEATAEVGAGPEQNEVLSHEGICEPDTSDRREGIFRPMKSLFASLAEKASEEKRPSMAPSVFCPEVDNDQDSGPQWCIDSVEVFADIEGDDCDLPTACKGTRSQKLLEILKQRQASAMEAAVPGSVDSCTGMQKSIFAPLDDNLAFKLSPSAETEEMTTKAVRKIPLIKPSM